MSVDADCAVSHVVETCQQVDHRRLAGASLPNECDGLAWLDIEVDIVQHLGLFVAEPDAIEDNVSFNARKHDRVWSVGDLALGIENRVNPLTRSGCRLERVVGL